MASSTLLVLSLRSPFFPIPMASSHRRDRLRATPVAAAAPCVSIRSDLAPVTVPAFWIVAADPDRRADPAHTGIISDLNRYRHHGGNSPEEQRPLHHSGRRGAKHVPLHHRGGQAGPAIAGRRAADAAHILEKVHRHCDGGSAPRVGEVFSHWTGVGTAGREACPLSARRHAGRGESFPSRSFSASAAALQRRSRPSWRRLLWYPPVYIYGRGAFNSPENILVGPLSMSL